MPCSVFNNIWEKIRGKGLFADSKINIRGPKNELSYYTVPISHGFNVCSYFSISYCFLLSKNTVVQNLVFRKIQFYRTKY
jgi:hypothetical protein